MSKGYRFCSFPCARESRANALLVIERYPCVLDGSARETGAGVAFTLDLAALPPGDGAAAELMVLRDIQRAVSLHER
jgi:hypothetical protein